MKDILFFSALLLSFSILYPCALRAEAPSPEAALTIEDCVKLASENSRTLHIAGLKVQSAIAQKNEVRSAFFPQISAEGVWDNNNHSLSGELTQFQDFHSNTALGLSVNLGLWDFGSSLQRLKAGRYRISAAEKEREKTALEVEEEVRTAYLKVLEKEKAVDVVQVSIQTLRSQLTKSKDMFKQGEAKYTDVLQVQVQLAEKKKRLLMAKNNLLAQKMSLNMLIGIPVFSEYSLREVEEKNDLFSFETAWNYAMEHRPDLRAMRGQVAALAADRKATRRSWAPQIYAFGNTNFSYTDAKASVSAGIGMKMPIYEGGRRQAQTQKIESEMEQLRASLENLTNGISIDVKNTCLEFEEIQNSLTLDKKSIALAERSLHDTVQLYEQGLLSINDLLIADEQLINVKMNYFTNLYRYHIACAHLKTITGGMSLE